MMMMTTNELTRHAAPRLRILVAHANPLIAVGLAAALRRNAEFEVAVDGLDDDEDHDDPHAALPAGHVARPHDVIVADSQTGLRRAAAQQRAGSTPAPRVLVMSAELREHEVRQALEQGVHGYLPLDSGIDEFVQGVRTVARGARYLAPSTAECMAASLTREALTTRQAEVLALLADGQCNKSIARQLDIALGTVKAHVKGIMAKLDVSSRTQAVSVAAQRGLVQLTTSTHRAQAGLSS